MGITVKAIDMKETTALGAALVAMKGIGIYKSIEEALLSVENQYEEYYPGKNSPLYKDLYLEFSENVL
jgi:glycerol kinase